MITFLLTDVVGSTALWDADAPGMAGALVLHDAALAEVIAEHDGTLVKPRGEGDSTFSVYSSTASAAAAALAAHRRLRSIAWPPGLEIVVRAGIHVGEAEARDGDYYGPTVNRAARLRGLAGPGETLVSRTAADVLADDPLERWELEDLGSRSLRGLSRPEHVHRLVDPEQPVVATPGGPADPADRAARELPEALVGNGAPIVGRSPEATRLRTAWGEVVAGAGRAVLVGGEPGIGKTTLAGDLARLAHGAGATVLHGRCDEHVGISYQPFVEAVRSLVDVTDDATLAAAPRTAAELTRLVPELADRLADLPEPIADEPEAERYALFHAVGDLLRSAAEPTPILLVLDDLHWATAPTALLVGHLLRQQVPRLLVVATYRDTEVGAGHPMQPVLGDAWRIAGVERIELRGLDAGAVTQLLEHASGHPVDERGELLAGRLEEETGGNPFFVVELLRHLAETGVIYEDGGRWTSDLDVTSMPLPDSVVEVLAQRLGRLDDEARSILTCAAVVGSELDVDLLARASEAAEDRVLDVIEVALDAGLLVERSEEVTFAHALVRASLLTGLSVLRRRRWHRTIADVLVARPESARPVEALAHHYGEAALADRSLASVAARFGHLAARKAIAALAHEEALGRVDRALAALQLADEVDLDLRCDLLLAAAAASFALVGRTDACRRPALAAGADALALADPERVAQAAELAMGGLVMTYDTANELGIVEGAMALPSSDAITARLTAARALALLGAGRSGDQEEAARAIELARASGDDVALIAALHARSASLLRSHDLAERIALAAELRDLRGHATGVASRVALSPTDVDLYLGSARLVGGDLDGLHAEIDEIEALYAANGDWELRYFAIAHRATLAAIHGDLSALAGWADEMIAHDATRPPDPELRSFHPITDGSSIGNNSIRLYAAYQFILHRERGELEGLLPLFEQAVADDPSVVVFGAALAVALADLGMVDEARARFEATLAGGMEGLPRDQIWPLLLGVLCEACALSGAAEWASALRAEAELYAGQISAGAIATIVFDLMDRCLGVLDVAEERWDDAIERFDSAASQAVELEAPVWEARALAWAAFARARRGAPGDAEVAVDQRELARARAVGLGYAGLTEAVVRLDPRG